jgi:iron complex transport system permease protein
MAQRLRPYFIVFLLLGFALLLSVAVGSVWIPPGTTARILFSKLFGLSGDWALTDETILLAIRLPHAVLIALTGAALAGSGAAYQGLFRNPLADPYLMGVAAGAGLGAVIAMALVLPGEAGLLPGWLGLYTIPLMAFLGAVLTVGLVYTISSLGGGSVIANLILAGVAVGSFASAISSFLMLRSQGEMRRAVAWLLGGGTMGGWEPVAVILPYVALGLGILVVSGHALNVLQFGEEQAQQLGLSVKKVRLLLICAASLATAAAVAFSGLIGFIGLMVPHVIRMLWGPDYRRLVPLSILAGASALLVADLLARLVMAPQVLPLGVVTALFGAPFFLWVLVRTRGRVES